MNNYLIIILIIIFFLLFNKKTNPKNEEFGISTVKSDFHYKELKKRKSQGRLENLLWLEKCHYRNVHEMERMEDP